MVTLLGLPILAVCFSLWPSDFVEGMLHPSVWPALRLSVFTTTISLVLMMGLGTPLAWHLSQRHDAPAQVLETLLRLPAVLPPAVAGVGLLLAFGRQGWMGPPLAWLGIRIPFSWMAVVLAGFFVAAPFYMQSAIAAFRVVDAEQILVARTLGASPGRLFFRIAIPGSRGGLIAGGAMAWARALGEFGATLLFAGNMRGVTQTLPLAVYSAFESDLRAASAMSMLMIGVAFGLLLLLSLSFRRSS